MRNWLSWFRSQTGLGASSHFESGAFARSSAQQAHPDLQFQFLPSIVHEDGRVFGNCHGYQVNVGPLRPKSRGYIMLASRDPRRHPLINPNYLDHSDDFISFRHAVRLSRELFAQRSFDEFRGDELSPGPNVIWDKQLDEFVRSKATSAYNPCCTCKMGSSSDEYAVVDPRTMAVHGLESIYIVDASVMPSIVSGGLNAPTIMLAERAADLIQGKATLSAKSVPVWTP